MPITISFPNNFNSIKHDESYKNSICVPTSDEGKYLMYSFARSGNKQNHRKFSPCR